MMQPRRQWQRDMTFGGRIPWAVGMLLCITAAVSLFTAFSDRHGTVLKAWLSLQPAACWRGQIWRLVTWPFVEPAAWGLIFNCLMLYWFGPSLVRRYGSRRFLSGYFGTIAVAAMGTCLIALVDPEVMNSVHLGGWATATAMLVIWGLSYPDNIIRIYFVIPIRGFWFAWGTVALTVIYCAYSGWAPLLPELLGELTVLAWFYRKRLAVRWQSVKGSLPERPRPPRSEERGVVVDLRTGKPRDPNELN